MSATPLKCELLTCNCRLLVSICTLNRMVSAIACWGSAGAGRGRGAGTVSAERLIAVSATWVTTESAFAVVSGTAMAAAKAVAATGNVSLRTVSWAVCSGAALRICLLLYWLKAL